MSFIVGDLEDLELYVWEVIHEYRVGGKPCS